MFSERLLKLSREIFLICLPSRLVWRLGPKRLPAGQFRVGIVWQGKSTADVDFGRSIPLRSFAPLCRIPGLTLISLQKHHGVRQLAHLPPGMSVEKLSARNSMPARMHSWTARRS